MFRIRRKFCMAVCLHYGNIIIKGQKGQLCYEKKEHYDYIVFNASNDSSSVLP